MGWGSNFGLSESGSPHLNGKVEREQKTDLDEFYIAVCLKVSDLEDNSLNGNTIITGRDLIAVKCQSTDGPLL